MKNYGKPGIVREFFIIFIQVREKPGKTDYLVHVLFSSVCIVPRKGLFNLLLINVNFIILHSAIASSCTLPIYQASFSFPIFVNMSKLGQE